jgi:flagellar hook-associated protein 1 FlgK
MSGISSFFGLQTSLRGLLAHQGQLDVTAHNIANAATEGYSRQRAEVESVIGLEVQSGALANGGGAMLGGGVNVTAYQRARDVFADLQLRGQSTLSGQARTTANSLSTVELALNEPGENGIGSLLSHFWDAWQGVANHPEDAAAKKALVVDAKSLTDGLHALDGQLVSIRDHAAAELTSYTSVGGDILENAKAIARLNGEISAAVGAGRQPNDLMDQRDRLIDRLAELGQITVTDLANGSLQISFGGVASPLLVDDATAWAPTPPATTLYSTPSAGGIVGALQNLSQAGTGTIDTYRSDLDTFVNQLVTSVNTAHGAPFFAAAGLTAGTVAVDAGIVTAPTTIRTTNTAPPGPGANDVALAVAGLRGGTADRTYAGFVLRVGSDARDANRRDAAATAVFDAAQERRSQISGVSLDEEMANMIKFQRGYQASARTMSTLDEMLDVLINRTGRVGL